MNKFKLGSVVIYWMGAIIVSFAGLDYFYHDPLLPVYALFTLAIGYLLIPMILFLDGKNIFFKILLLQRRKKKTTTQKGSI